MNEELSQYSILYVDDEESNLRIFKTAFKRQFNLLTASSGQEALELMAEQPIHLIITDQKMPNMTGVELLERVAKLYPNTVRIILTGFSDIELIVRAINNCGVFRYLSKPWDRENMQQVIEDALSSYMEVEKLKNLVKELSLQKQELEAEIIKLKQD